MKPCMEYIRGRFSESAACENRQFNRLASKRIHAKEMNCHNSVTPATLSPKRGKPVKIKIQKYRKPSKPAPQGKAPPIGRHIRRNMKAKDSMVQGLRRFE